MQPARGEAYRSRGARGAALRARAVVLASETVTKPRSMVRARVSTRLVCYIRDGPLDTELHHAFVTHLPHGAMRADLSIRNTCQPLARAAAEALLGRGPHPVVLDLSNAADMTMWPLSATRGFRVLQLMLLWQRPLPGAWHVEFTFRHTPSRRPKVR